MLPAVRKVEDIELIRDGGSFAATFESDGGERYILFVEIDTEISVLRDRKLARYSEPVLIDCDPAKRPRNTATVFYSELGGPSVPISWSEARSLIAEISKYASSSNVPNNQWLMEMIDVISRDGRPAHSPADSL